MEFYYDTRGINSVMRYTHGMRNICVNKCISPYSRALPPDVYLGPCETSMMELLCENSQRVKPVSYFRKRTPS